MKTYILYDTYETGVDLGEEIGCYNSYEEMRKAARQRIEDTDGAKELRARGYEVFLASGGGRLADELKTAGIRTFFVPIRQSRFLSVWRVSSIVKKYHIDIIHANSGAAGIIAARVKRNTSVPVVYTAHGILGNMEKEYVIDQLDQIICVSEYVRRDSLARGLHENHLLVRYSGIDTERFTANEEERARSRRCARPTTP